ncbi:MAG: FliA/WhiG family RNA polymerase sigma factor [Deltaproteobacteria bacterium]|jgi:RNA polymerase sigma factor for flagellar operon FliA|nr:FliA/WhiG family RNA polymerase sigma factor [Deltaproteobacteria bacterium]
MSINIGTYGPCGQPVGNAGWKGLSMEERTAYVEKYASLIKYLAERLAARLPEHVAKEDLMSSGVLGLIDAVEKFEPDRGIMFKTYAEFRIRGAMLDELRSLDWVPRAVRKKAAELERLWRKLEIQLGQPPTDEQSAAALGVDLAAYHKMVDEISVINMLDLENFRLEASGGGRDSLDLYEVLRDENCLDALTVLGQEELRQVLADAIDALPEKQKLVVTLYYHEDLTMKEIGQVMGYTESRISQLHGNCVDALRLKLARYFEHRGREALEKAASAKEEKTSRRRGARKPKASPAAAPEKPQASSAPEAPCGDGPRPLQAAGAPALEGNGPQAPSGPAVFLSSSADGAGAAGAAPAQGAAPETAIGAAAAAVDVKTAAVDVETAAIGVKAWETAAETSATGVEAAATGVKTGEIAAETPATGVEAAAAGAENPTLGIETEAILVAGAAVPTAGSWAVQSPHAPQTTQWPERPEAPHAAPVSVPEAAFEGPAAAGAAEGLQLPEAPKEP